MSFRQQFRWGGMWILVVAVLVSVTNIIVSTGKQSVAIQAVYFVGFTGLVLTCTIIHITQARRAGVLGTLAYLICAPSLVYSNVINFLILAELSGMEGARQTIIEVWSPVMQIAIYGVYGGWALLGISVAEAGVFPRRAGILLALGVAVQLPAQFAMGMAEPLFVLFTIGGSILFGAGLSWIGRALWSGEIQLEEKPSLSNLDRAWGAPFVMLAGLLLVVNAYVNSIPDLTLVDGIVYLVSITALMFTIVILHTAQADRAGGVGMAGFFFTHLGATLNVITAYFIMAQLAGQLEDNRALMASWVDIPVGRFGNYLLLSGIFLFGVGVLRAEVFPRSSGWLVVIGLALSLPGLFTTQDYLFSIFAVIGAVLEGVGIGWMGWTLLHRGATKQVVRLNESTS